MGYKSLTQLYNDLSSAVNSVSGLGELFMIDESEINKIKVFNPPFCVLEIPNSSISNVNKAWEEYEISFFVLNKQMKNISDYGTLGSYYDTCMSKFSDFITEVLKQRNGSYVIDRESFQIERLNDFSNHLLSGVKVNFTLLAPSYIGYYEPESEKTWSVTSNLIALWNGNKNVTRTNTSISWESWKGLTRYLVHSNSNNVPAYSAPSFTFENPTSSSGGDEGLTHQGAFSFSGASWSIFFQMSIEDTTTANVSDGQTIFRITDPSSGDGFVFSLKTHGDNTDIDGIAQYHINEDGIGDVDDVNSINFEGTTLLEFTPSADLAPFSNGMIGLVNDADNNVIRLYAGDNVYVSTNAHNNQFTLANLFIGSSRLEEWDFNFKQLNGTISHIAIYNGAISAELIPTIKTELALL